MLHDIQYLQYSGIKNVDEIDDLAIKLSDYDLPGIATKIGLTLRKALGLTFNKHKRLSDPDARILGSELMNFVKTNPIYAQLFQKYNIDPRLY